MVNSSIDIDIDESNADSGNGSETNNSTRSLRERPPQRAVTQQAARRTNRLQSKFLEDFDPEQSSRERRKLTRKTYSGPQVKNTLFDESGKYRSNGMDACDCLDIQCSGCHMPCPGCGNRKCSTTCRNHRKWAFETIEHDGKDLVIRNRIMMAK